MLTSITQCIGQEDTDAEEYNWSIRDLEDNICVPRTISSNHSNIHESFGTEPHARIQSKKALPYLIGHPSPCTVAMNPIPVTALASKHLKVGLHIFHAIDPTYANLHFHLHAISDIPPSIQSPMQDKKLEEKKKKEKISSHDMYATCQSETYINIK